MNALFSILQPLNTLPSLVKSAAPTFQWEYGAYAFSLASIAKIFKSDTSKIIKKSSLLREKSDYEDFYEASKDDAKACIKDAEKLIEEVEIYLLSK